MSRVTVRIGRDYRLTGDLVEWLPNGGAAVDVAGVRYAGRRVLSRAERDDLIDLGPHLAPADSAVSRHPQVDAVVADGGQVRIWPLVVVTSLMAPIWWALGVPIPWTFPLAFLVGVGMATNDWLTDRKLEQMQRDADTWYGPGGPGRR